MAANSTMVMPLTDILRAAGIEHAKVFVLAIDDIEDSMNVARDIRLNYPDLNLLVRARTDIMCICCVTWG